MKNIKLWIVVIFGYGVWKWREENVIISKQKVCSIYVLFNKLGCGYTFSQILNIVKT